MGFGMNLRLWKLVLVALAALPCVAQAQTFIREELRIPAPGAGSRGLEAILVRPSVPEPLPLVVITHGSALKREEWRAASPLAYLPQATEFARRGWATAIVMRRGFGDSGGDYAAAPGPCTNPNYVASATTDTIDLRAGIAHLRKRPDIDGARLLVVGQSSGGLAAVALTADPPSGLLAAINFAGGKIATRASEACKGTEDRLVEAFNTFGKRSRTPMLWIYSENDKVFPPELAERFKDAFSAGGGNVEFIKALPFRTDGHNLFSSTGISYWAPYIDRFLAKQNLVLRDIPLPLPPPPDIAPPDQLSTGGRRSFDDFLRSPPHRAFAVSSNGAYGWNSGRRTAEEATKRAIESCSKHANDCVIVVVDDNAVR
jgi:dienelactone hydrolase